MASPIYFRPAIPLLIAFIGGILVGSEWTGVDLWAWAAVCTAAAFSLLLIYRRKPAVISPLLLFFSLGSLAVSPWASPGFPADHIVHFAGTQRWIITGRIAERPQMVNHRTRFILYADALDNGRQRRPVIGKLRVSARGKLPALAAGDTIAFKSRIRLISNFKNPAGFDYRRYMAYRAIWTTAYLNAENLEVIDKSRTSGIFQFLDKTRRVFAELVDNSGTPETRAVLKALIIGDRSHISPQARQRFNRAGVGHLLAISGLHIGIVASVAFFLFNAVMVRIKPLLWRAWSRKAAALAALLPVVAYGLVAGFSPSTQRAVIMVAVFLMTFLFQREQDPLNTLALAALIILVTNPPSLFDISFQLSFTAVFAIIYGFSRLQDRPAAPRERQQGSRRLRLRKKLASFFLVSFFAVCGSLPLVAYYFNQISLVGLAANIIVVPLVGFIVIPLGLAALFAMPFGMPLAAWCVAVDSHVLNYALGIINFFSDLPFAAVNIVTPDFIAIGSYYVLGWALLNLSRRGPNATSADQSMDAGSGHLIQGRDGDLLPVSKSGLALRPRIVSSLKIRGFSTNSLAKLAVVLVLCVLTADTCFWLYQRFWHQDLRVTVIDVGNGFASLLELPGGYTILLDGGGFSDNAAFDVGARILAPLLRHKKIRTVDAIILSHPDSDHLNGLIYIADNFHVKNIWTNGESADTVGYAMLLNVVTRRAIFRPVFENMSRRCRVADVELEFLYPPPDFLRRKNAEKWRNSNNNSLVVKVTFGATSFLFPGDIMAEAEAEIVHSAGSKLSSTVLIAPHHGSRTSSSRLFLDEVDPKYIIISCGRNMRFPLPNAAVLKRYQKRGCTIWRTDMHGAIQMTTNGRRLEIRPFERQ